MLTSVMNSYIILQCHASLALMGQWEYCDQCACWKEASAETQAEAQYVHGVRSWRQQIQCAPYVGSWWQFLCLSTDTMCSLGWILVAILVPVFCLQQLLLFVHQWHLWWEQQLQYLPAQNKHADENRKVNCYPLHCQKQVTNTHVLVFQKTTHSASESDNKLAVKSLTWLTWCKASESDTKLTVKSLTWLTWCKASESDTKLTVKSLT